MTGEAPLHSGTPASRLFLYATITQHNWVGIIIRMCLIRLLDTQYAGFVKHTDTKTMDRGHCTFIHSFSRIQTMRSRDTL